MAITFDPKAYGAWFESPLGRRVWADEEHALFSVLQPEAGSRVLDAGCGDGRLLLSLARRGVRVVGADASATMLRAAHDRARAAGQSVQLVRADVGPLPFADRSFDATVTVTVLGNATTQPSAEPTPVVAPTSGLQPGAVVPSRPPRPAPAGTLQMNPINPPAIPGPEPDRRTGDATIMITLHGAVAEAVIADPQGRRLGFDPGAGEHYTDVSDASYLSTGLGTVLPDGRIVDDQPWTEVYFNAPTDGEYRVVVIGNKAGAYTLHIGAYDVGRRSSWFKAADVPIAPGERHEYRFHFSAADAGNRGLDGRRVQRANR